MDSIARLKDPRYYQIVVLGLLLSYGILALDFGIHWQNAIAIITTAQVVQFVSTRAVGLPRFDPLSALITSLSLTLLLRTDVIALAMLAAVVAISSKFLIRVRNKHVFNPANVALVTLMLISDKPGYRPVSGAAPLLAPSRLPVSAFSCSPGRSVLKQRSHSSSAMPY
jgi:hypothetical protein